MEIIRISDTKLKVTLDYDDMTRYDLCAEQMDYDNTETRRVIWQILDEAKHRTGFNAAEDRILIQAYPGRKGGCEIYVTKLNPQAETASPPALRGRISLFVFRDAALLFTVCRKIAAGGRKYESALYEEVPGGVFWLLVREHMQNSIMNTSKLSPLSFVEEYTERCQSSSALAYIKEHGECLLKEGAIESLAPYAAG